MASLDTKIPWWRVGGVLAEMGDHVATVPPTTERIGASDACIRCLTEPVHIPQNDLSMFSCNLHCSATQRSKPTTAAFPRDSIY